MNWFSRVFRRSRSDDVADYAEYPGDFMVETVPLPAKPLSAVPGFATSSSLLDPMVGGGPLVQAQIAYRRAFLPSQPVASASLFAGRTDLLRRVIRAIEDQHLHVIVYGDRGIGKTSVLRVVSELATRAKYVVQYTSCGEDSDFSEIFRAIAARIPLLYDNEYDPAVEAVERGGTLADKLPSGNFTVSQLSELMANIAGTRILIILDEFDRATSPKFRNSIAELIKNLSDRAVPVQLLIAGVASNLTHLIAHVPSIRRNIVGIGVPNMTDDEIRELVAIGESAGKVRFSAGAVQQLIEYSAGLPYLASLLGQHAALAAGEEGAREVEAAHVELARHRSAEDIGSRLSPAARFALSTPDDLRPDEFLAATAGEAVRNGGIIVSNQLVDRITQLALPQKGLFEPCPDHPQGAWRYAEDGASTYVWLLTRSTDILAVSA